MENQLDSEHGKFRGYSVDLYPGLGHGIVGRKLNNCHRVLAFVGSCATLVVLGLQGANLGNPSDLVSDLGIARPNLKLMKGVPRRFV